MVITKDFLDSIPDYRLGQAGFLNTRSVDSYIRQWLSGVMWMDNIRSILGAARNHASSSSEPFDEFEFHTIVMRSMSQTMRDAILAGVERVPKLMLWFCNYEHGIPMPSPAFVGPWRRHLMLSDVPESIRLRVADRLRETADHGGMNSYDDSGSSLWVVGELLTAMAQGLRPIPARLVGSYVVGGLSSIMPEYRHPDAARYMADNLKAEDFDGAFLVRYAAQQMSCTVTNASGRRVGLSGICSLGTSTTLESGQVGIKWLTPLGGDVDTHARARAARILSHNYVRSLAERAYEEWEANSDRAYQAVVKLAATELVTPEQIKTAAQVLGRLLLNSTALVEAMRAKVVPAAFGGRNLSESDFHINTVAQAVRKVLPVLKEKRGTYYEALHKEVEKASRAAGINLNEMVD